LGELNPRQRALAVAERRRPAVMASVFKATPEVDRLVCDHFGAAEPEELIPILGLCHLHWPWRHVRPRGLEDVRREGALQFDVWGVGRKEVSYGAGTYWEFVHHPLAGARTVADVERHAWPSADGLDFSNVLEECRRHADTALSITEWSVFETAWQIRGPEQFLMDLADDEPMARAVIERVEQFRREVVERLWELAGPHFQFFGLTDDLGSQHGLLMSPRTWDRFFTAGFRWACDFAHRRGLKTWLHCDGAVRPLIPRFIEAGLDILDPLMPAIEEMNPYSIARQFGRDLCFHGTIDVQRLVPFGSERQVRDEVRRQLDELWPAANLYMAPSHCFQPGTPLRNILAVYDELARAGG